MAHYVDTSALTKLVVSEAESAPLLSWISTEDTDLVSSDLARAELLRAMRRVAADVVQARAVLDSLTLMVVTTAIVEAAGRLDPTVLRTLDAIHLAAALQLDDDLAGIVTYDERLADAARSHGIEVVAP